MTARIIRPRGKIGRTPMPLASGRPLNRFQAENLGDHCHHSITSAGMKSGWIAAKRRSRASRDTPPGVVATGLVTRNVSKLLRLLGIARAA